MMRTIEPTSTSQDHQDAWWRRPDLREPLARLAAGEASPDDMRVFADAAPTQHRDAVPFMARSIRACGRLRAARLRAADEAMQLVRLAVETRDGRAAVAACRTIATYALLDEPKQPRLVGCVVEPDCALDIEEDDVILTHDVLNVSGVRALLALVAPESAVPRPSESDAAVEARVERLADAVLREVQ